MQFGQSAGITPTEPVAAESLKPNPDYIYILDPNANQDPEIIEALSLQITAAGRGLVESFLGERASTIPLEQPGLKWVIIFSTSTNCIQVAEVLEKVAQLRVPPKMLLIVEAEQVGITNQLFTSDRGLAALGGVSATVARSPECLGQKPMSMGVTYVPLHLNPQRAAAQIAEHIWLASREAYWSAGGLPP